MPLKAALCFIINYDHELVKEDLWKKWIEPNKDIINVYFFYSDLTKIKSDWIKSHALPKEYIKETSYLHVLPAYIQLLHYAYKTPENEWFMFLTDFCVPIMSPEKFRQLFFMYNDKTFISYKKAWWNVNQQSRANLKYIPQHLHLANSPWFTLTRYHVQLVKRFIKTYNNLTTTIYNGPVANESFFAIVLHQYNELTKDRIIKMDTHVADWSRMSSSTSPHIFKIYDKENKKYIENVLDENNFAMFLRKIDKEFPDEVIEKEIWHKNNNLDPTYTLICPAILSKPLYFYLPLFVYRNKTVFKYLFFLLLFIYVLY